MKQIVKSAGCAAVGLLSLASASAQTYGLAPNLTPQELSKTWSVSAALRGFYDDNYNTSPTKQDSFGLEFAPTISANFPLEQTFIGFSVIYSLRYYENRPEGEFDQSVQINGVLAHSFSERIKLDLNDNFALSQEPEILSMGPLSTPFRTEGSNIRNRASASLTTGLTPTFSAVWGYANTFYDYEQEGATGSRSALLDRMEHLFSINGRWQISPATIGIVGYQYGIVDYTSDDLLVDPTTLPPGASQNALAESRNSTSHYGFVGVDQSFTAQLVASLRGGIQYAVYPNAVLSTESQLFPYGDASLSWTYAPGSYLNGGLRHQLSSTDVAYNIGGVTPTLDSSATVVYAAINHQFTAKLTASLLGQVQFSTFNQGNADALSETLFGIGANVAYRINQFLSAEAGYSFDTLETDLPGRNFDRNRVYLGLRGNY